MVDSVIRSAATMLGGTAAELLFTRLPDKLFPHWHQLTDVSTGFYSVPYTSGSLVAMLPYHLVRDSPIVR